MNPLVPATTSFLAAAGSGTVGSGVPDIGVSGYLVNLLVVLAIMGAFAYVALRFGKGRLAMPIGLRGRDLKIEDRLPIDTQRALLVVSLGRRRWLVGMTQYAFTPVAELEPTGDFAQHLGPEVGQ
ncbi:MAG: flagellar biosynthetic protein FliO [Cyanobacteria bacterium REEB65]|nr:flagellar biosynthetic protein FliO [Cyanobacteria bacterium REEB65]